MEQYITAQLRKLTLQARTQEKIDSAAYAERYGLFTCDQAINDGKLLALELLTGAERDIATSAGNGFEFHLLTPAWRLPSFRFDETDQCLADLLKGKGYPVKTFQLIERTGLCHSLVSEVIAVSWK